MYRIDIMTLFPDVVGDMLCESVLGRGQERGYIRVECHQIRDYTVNKQKQVDDYPYGGGRGAVMQADPLYRCWEHICQEAGERVHTIYMSPAGKTFTQADARRLKDDYQRLILVCGHYEGIDERFIEECVDEEISLGDFVMTGGEIPAMAVADAVCRLVPGVLSDPSCYENESHWNGTLEAPQYSRPEVWHGRAVPSILLSGNHAKVDQWRRKQSILRTRQRRPDLYEKLDLSSKEDQKLLEELERKEELRTPFGAVYMFKNGERIRFKIEDYDYGMYLNDGTLKKPQGLYKLYPDVEGLKKDDIVRCEFDGGQLQGDGGGESWYNIVGTYQGYTIGMGAPDSQDIEDYDPQRKGILPYETLGYTERGFKMLIVDTPKKYLTKKVFQLHKLCFIVAWEQGIADKDWELISFVTC